MSGRRLDLSAQALADISGILQYTIEEWGIDQHERYAELIADTAQRVAQFPLRGRKVISSLDSLRWVIVAEHVMYYVIEPNEVTVLRVLHKSMDASRHLDLTDE